MYLHQQTGTYTRSTCCGALQSRFFPLPNREAGMDVQWSLLSNKITAKPSFYLFIFFINSLKIFKKKLTRFQPSKSQVSIFITYAASPANSILDNIFWKKPFWVLKPWSHEEIPWSPQLDKWLRKIVFIMEYCVTSSSYDLWD